MDHNILIILFVIMIIIAFYNHDHEHDDKRNGHDRIRDHNLNQLLLKQEQDHERNCRDRFYRARS